MYVFQNLHRCTVLGSFLKFFYIRIKTDYIANIIRGIITLYFSIYVVSFSTFIDAFS